MSTYYPLLSGPDPDLVGDYDITDLQPHGKRLVMLWIYMALPTR